MRVRSFICSRMALDPFGAQQKNCSYSVHSLYLDSPDLALHRSTINGDRNRFKLRIRFYENRPDCPVYCEIKRRKDEAIFKQRAAVTRETIDAIISGSLPPRESLKLESAAEERALMAFFQHVTQLQAKPVAHVSYRREAWYSPGHNRLRVTFDRQVMSAIEPRTRLDPALSSPVAVFGNSVVLELKYTGRFPDWMRDMVQACNLQRCSAAKYVDGILRMEEQGQQPSIQVQRLAVGQRFTAFR